MAEPQQATEPEFTEPELAEPIEVEVGGAILELPAGSTPDTIKKAVENFRASPEFDRMVDKSSGAPARVRMLVGSAPIQDRLANLKRFYPDAVQYGDDNFVFTDPTSGRPTLYNPSGLDVGDVASVAREGAQAVGGTLGATFGAAGGFALGVPGGPPGMVAAGSAGAATGAGLGTAAGGALFDVSASLLAGRIDTRSPLQASLDTAVDFFAGASGQRAGELVEAGTKAALGGGKQAAAQLAQKFHNLGIRAPGGAVSGSKAIGSAEKMLSVTPSSAGVMQKQAEEVMDQTAAAAVRTAQRFGPIRTEAGAGESIKAAAIRAADAFRFTQEKVYQEAFDLVGPDTAVPVSAVNRLWKQMIAELSRAPNALDDTLRPAIRMLGSIQDDAGADGIAFEALRQIRTNVGRDLAKPHLVGSSGSQNEALKRVYAALTEDLSEAAKQAGPAAAKKLAVADRYTRLFMNTTAKTLEKITKFDADEKAYRFVVSATKDSAQMLARLRRSFTDEEWDTVAGTVLGRMGLAKPNAQNATGEVFSVNTFLTNWSRMTPEARETMFGGSRYKELADGLSDLVDVVSSLKAVERLTNTSNTASHIIAWSHVQILAGALAGMATGGAGAGQAATGAVTSVVSPWAAAKLITNPSFVKWLITPVTKTNGISAHLGRLTQIAIAEPEIKEEIYQYLQAFRPTPGPASPRPGMGQ